jgi:hypothetical protein
MAQVEQHNICPVLEGGHLVHVTACFFWSTGMPVQITWYDEGHTILYYRFEKTWKLEDVYDTLNTGLKMMSEVEHPVDSIFDFTRTGTPPPQMLSAARYAERHTPKNLRHTAICGLNPFLSVLANITQKIAPRLMKNTLITRTLEDAINALEERRHTQPNR